MIFDLLRGAPPAPVNPRRDGRILALAALCAVGLAVIGLRFLLTPELAARAFGLAGKPNGFQLHAAVALRDLWLGLLALALVWLADWRGLTLWFALGALVCFGDAGIVVGADGRPVAVLFHMASGIVFGVLAALAWRRASRLMPASQHLTDATKQTRNGI